MPRPLPPTSSPGPAHPVPDPALRPGSRPAGTGADLSQFGQPPTRPVMSAPQTLVQAAINRLTARLGSGLVDAAAGLSALAQDAPELLRREWDLFREEVELEAQRLEHPAAGSAGASHPASGPDDQPDPQQQVDDLRATVARLARLLEAQG
ncbi:MAG: hypothetical protein RLZZ219_721 [Cyanobacteriota bacterium]